MHTIEELLNRLSEYAEWCDANEWEIPITMGDDIREAIDTIKRYKSLQEAATVTLQTPIGNETWEYERVDSNNTGDFVVIWRCKRCGFKRPSSGWNPPYYNCPACSGRYTNIEEQQSTKGDPTE